LQIIVSGYPIDKVCYPGATPEDFAVDALAACAGLAVAAGLDWAMPRLRWNTKAS
jgi:hypothetical protein